jgi:hypothetical protein
VVARHKKSFKAFIGPVTVLKFMKLPNFKLKSPLFVIGTCVGIKEECYWKMLLFDTYFCQKNIEVWTWV